MAWQCFSWVKHWASFFLRKSSASKSCTSVAEPRTVPIPPKETSENVLAASNSDQTRDDLVASVDERLEAVNRAKVESSGSDHKIDGRSRPAPVAKQEAELERGTVANRAHSDILPGNKHTTTSKPPGPASALQSQTNLPIQSVLARDDGEAVLMSEAPVPRRERKPSLTTSGQVISGNGTGPSKAFEGVDLNRAPTIVVGDSGSYTLPGVRHGKEIANLDRTVTALGVTPPGVRMHATGMDLFAVFDGQGDYGRQVVELLSAQLAGVVQHTVRGTGEQNMSLVLEEAFASLDHQLQASGIDVSLSGCAGTVAISVCDRLIVGNVGNCSALIGSERGGRWVRTELSVCHDLTSASERDRLVNHGATLCRSETQLDSKEEVLLRRTLKGKSQGFVCTRFLGLSEGNNVGLHSRPEIFVRTLRPEDKFLIICSDGVWNHLSGEEAVDLVRAHTSAQEAAWELASEARRRSKLSSMMKNYR
jgi:serine/threonine protein phosphatase PrpC